MLRRLRSRAIDGATNLVRLFDARRERDELRKTVEHVLDERDDARRERDEYARLVATREVEIDELLRLRREIKRSQEYEQGTSAAIRELRDLLWPDCPADMSIHDLSVSVQALVVERDAAHAAAEKQRAKAERYYSMADALHADLEAALAELDARIPNSIAGAMEWLELRGYTEQTKMHDFSGLHGREDVRQVWRWTHTDPEQRINCTWAVMRLSALSMAIIASMRAADTEDTPC